MLSWLLPNLSTAMIFGNQKPVKFDGCEVFIWLLISSMLLNPAILLGSLYSLDPLNTRYLYHFFSADRGMTWSFWLWGLVDYLGHLCFIAPWVLVLILTWVYSRSTTFWLRKIRYFYFVEIVQFFESKIILLNSTAR